MTSSYAGLVFCVIGAGTLLQAQPQPTQPPLPWLPEALATNAIGSNAEPRIQFATPIYDFGRAKVGEPVKYSYYFTNTGCGTLYLTNVQPSCGCTTAGQWTRQVEPGQSGVIPIQFNPPQYSGQIFKTISVTSNDKGQPTVVLQLKGTVWKPIDFTPPYTVLNVLADADTATASVRIVNNMEEPLMLEAPECSSHAFSAQITNIEPGKVFQLTLSSVPPLNPGAVQGRISVKTSSTNVPVLDIPFWVNVQPPVTIFPPQLMLPAPPLQNTTTRLTIQNNSTNNLTLSEPTVNVAGAEVDVKELQTGRVFTVSLSFPKEFEIPKSGPIAFTAKTSNPRYPLVKVPILQAPRPPQPPPQVLQTPPLPVPLKPVPGGPNNQAATP